MALIRNSKLRPRILVVGGGYLGLTTAQNLLKNLGRGEATVTVVDPVPYMAYLPFLPEVAAGSIEPRHAIVTRRRHLKKTANIAGKVVNINHAAKTATIEPNAGENIDFEYDHIVITTGSVSRTFPIPGVAERAIGMKTIEEAIYVRDRMIGNFERAAELPKGSPERERLLTVTVVGGGFAGVETVGELRSLATYLVQRYPEISFSETKFHLVEAMERIMPEVSLKTAEWVVADQRRRGVDVYLNTQLTSAVDGVMELSNGD